MGSKDKSNNKKSCSKKCESDSESSPESTKKTKCSNIKNIKKEQIELMIESESVDSDSECKKVLKYVSKKYKLVLLEESVKNGLKYFKLFDLSD